MRVVPRQDPEDLESDAEVGLASSSWNGSTQDTKMQVLSYLSVIRGDR